MPFAQTFSMMKFKFINIVLTGKTGEARVRFRSWIGELHTRDLRFLNHRSATPNNLELSYRICKSGLGANLDFGVEFDCR